MYDVLPVAMVAGRQVSGLFAATMIGTLVAFFRAAVGSVSVLTLGGCSPRSCELRLSGSHLGCDLVRR